MLEIKDSPIHGKGLFTTTAIRRGKIIGTMHGKSTKRNGKYVIWQDDHNGTLITNEFKYLNHDGVSNATVYDNLKVVAKRNIKAGEEITINYEGLE